MCRTRARRAQEARLVEAVKQGDAPAALLAALRQEQERRSTLEAEHQRLVDLEQNGALDEKELAAELVASAANFRAALAERTPEARRVLQALVQDRLESEDYSRALRVPPSRAFSSLGLTSPSAWIVASIIMVVLLYAMTASSRTSRSASKPAAGSLQSRACDDVRIARKDS